MLLRLKKVERVEKFRKMENGIIIFDTAYGAHIWQLYIR